ncbi:MAG: hypothetical protein IPO92_08110, partial [Saprospiraceae bacterium]|nr:hypothetical protein [Saprospiraceae bacterium]
MIYNLDGKLLNSVSLDPELNYINNFSIVHWENGRDIFLLASGLDKDVFGLYFSFLDVLKSNINGGFDMVRRFIPKEKLRCVVPNKV